MYATHQIAKYLSDPRQSHGEAILYLVCYLKNTRTLGLKLKPNPEKGFYESQISVRYKYVLLARLAKARR